MQKHQKVRIAPSRHRTAIQHRSGGSPLAGAEAVLALQRSAGNAAVCQLIASTKAQQTAQRAMTVPERTALTGAPGWPSFDTLANQYLRLPIHAGDIDFGEELGDLVMARGHHIEAANTYRPWFLRISPRGSLAVKTARAYLAAGLGQKADAWYRVVRRGSHISRGGVTKLLVAPLPAPPEVAEANAHLMHLAPGDVPIAGVSLKRLEDHPNYDAGVRFKSEMKPTRAGANNIAFHMYGPLLTQYKAAITAGDAAAMARISGECTNKAFPDPATLVTPASAPNIDPGQEAIAMAMVNAFHVQYLAGGARDALELHAGIVQGVAPYTTQGAFSTHNGANWALFVMSASGRVYAAGHQVSRTHHSSPLAGGDVAAAGEIAVNAGTVVGVTNKSGHYAPDEVQMVQMLNRLTALGVNLANVKLRFHDATPVAVFWDTNASGFLADVGGGLFAAKLAALKLAVATRRGSGTVPFDLHQQVPIF